MELGCMDRIVFCDFKTLTASWTKFWIFFSSCRILMEKYPSKSTNWAAVKNKLNVKNYHHNQTFHYLKNYLNMQVFGILFTKLFWPSVRKTFEIGGWRPRIFKNLEITRTIYSNSERSEQFLVTECFFNLFLEVSHI